MNQNEEISLNGYDRKASVLKKIKYAVVVLLVLLLMFFFIGYREDITLENIRYLLKYVDVSPSAIGEDSNVAVSFDESAVLFTSVYRSDLVILTQNKIVTYDMSAKNGISDNHTLLNPALSVGKKYFAIFDMGENYFALYNSFSKIYEETTVYPIWDIELGDDGEFAVITAEKGYRSALKIYNNDFENKMNWYTSDKYIVSADLYAGKDAFYVAGCVKNSEDGDFLSSVIVLCDGSDKVETSVEFKSELIFETEFFENGNICVLTDEALRVIDLTGKELERIEFEPDSLRMFESGDDYAALVLNENSIGTEHRMIILDKKGNTSMDSVIDSDIEYLSVKEDNVILLGSHTLTAVNAENGEIKAHNADKSYSAVHALARQRAILIYENNAYVVSVE